MKNKLLLYAALIALCMCATGCISFHRIDPHDYPQMPSRKDKEAFAAAQLKMDTGYHGIWVVGNTNIGFAPFEKLDPVSLIFGNKDDPEPPDWFMPHECPLARKAAWWGRNPFHNLFFYGIGVADKDFVRFGKYPECVGNPNGGWMFAVAAYRHWRLPYISYARKRFKFYLGWRNHGNFGIKINF